MPGNKIGGQRAAQRNKQLYGEDYYIKIGAKGGRASGTGGFYANRELARTAGRKGGTISRPTNPWGHKTVPKRTLLDKLFRRNI